MMHTFYAKRPGSLWRMIAAGSFILHLSCASAQQTQAGAASIPASVAERYPAGSIQSVEIADAALAAVEQERDRLEARFTAEEQACLPKFFVTACVDDAKERRRQAMSKLRKVELEADAFKRRERVAEREKAAAERQASEAADRQERMREQRGNEGTDSVPQEQAEAVQPRPSSDREAQHEARIKRLEDDDRANAQKRAENMADYEKKVRESEERQKKVAQRKAEREEKRRAKHETDSGVQ